MIFVVSLFCIISENKSGLPQHENQYLSYFCVLIYFEEILEIVNFDLFSKYSTIKAVQVKCVRQTLISLALMQQQNVCRCDGNQDQVKIRSEKWSVKETQK
ncbi:Hypothetical_protein [Hexamita inflata]|uniref:Hypothetical_protein n=1 Tax=Hexamita inflata TaxID=28002 RepID=A0AA86RCE9_9EUKA|nr:Hypothetical protein HINF_LOCUS62630 [Hexamita inflata]